MTRGPVYRVVDGDMASSMALALEVRKLYLNAAPAHEGPGHRSCMLYSAVVCPHLASPGSRRKIETSIGSKTLPKGDPRGEGEAVVGYDGYTFDVSREEGLAVRFGQPVELLSFDNGTELVDELAAEIARESGNVQRCPPYLLDDDAKAEKAAKAIMMASSGSGPATAIRHEEQARKNRRKATRAARRKNR